MVGQEYVEPFWLSIVLLLISRYEPRYLQHIRVEITRPLFAILFVGGTNEEDMLVRTSYSRL